MDPVTTCSWCAGSTERVASFDAPPAGETDYGLAPYHRELWRCRRCGHVRNVHQLDLAGLYDGAYREATYGDRAAATYQRIMALPDHRSDNAARVARVHAAALAAGLEPPGPWLDVGSGLAVFPARLAGLGWDCTALEPDPAAVRHAEEVAGVHGRVGELADLSGTSAPGTSFVGISFNKVLEHVVDPATMLAGVHGPLADGGLVYVELPDAEGALDAGADREEFFVEHHHAFSAGSLCLLAGAAGLRVQRLERLVEPSSKYTLAAFLSAP